MLGQGVILRNPESAPGDFGPPLEAESQHVRLCLLSRGYISVVPEFVFHSVNRLQLVRCFVERLLLPRLQRDDSFNSVKNGNDLRFDKAINFSEKQFLDLGHHRLHQILPHDRSFVFTF